jgi:hypothetical protein
MPARGVGRRTEAAPARRTVARSPTDGPVVDAVAEQTSAGRSRAATHRRAPVGPGAGYGVSAASIRVDTSHRRSAAAGSRAWGATPAASVPAAVGSSTSASWQFSK